MAGAGAGDRPASGPGRPGRSRGGCEEKGPGNKTHAHPYTFLYCGMEAVAESAAMDAADMNSTYVATLKEKLDLHTVEARLLHELRTDWTGVDDKVGLLTVAEGHAFHWLLRDRHKELLVRDWDTPLEGVAYIQADFKQHVTLPVGPTETGDWWYANARSQSMFMMDV